MPGVSLSQLTQISNEVGPAILTGKGKRINDAVRLNYNATRYFLSANPIQKMLSGGSVIQDELLLNTNARARSVGIGEVESPSVTSTGTVWTARWRFKRTNLAYTKQHEILTMGQPTGEYGRYLAYKDVMMGLYQDMFTDWSNHMEDSLLAVPNTLTMESAGGLEMYSLFAHINEYTSGLYGAGYAGTPTGGDWTTKQGIDPAVDTSFVPVQKTYSNLTPDDANNLIAGLRKVRRAINYEPPAATIAESKYFEDNKISSCFVLCSEQGQENATRLWQSSNIEWDDTWDPAGNPRFAGWPFVYVKGLDTAAVYPTGSTNTFSTELDTGGTTNAGPRYYVIQPEFCCWVFHKDMFFTPETDFMQLQSQPDTFVRYYASWGNFVIRSPRRNAILYPNADIS